MKVLISEVKNTVDRVKGVLYGKMKDFEFEHIAIETIQSETHYRKKERN